MTARLELRLRVQGRTLKHDHTRENSGQLGACLKGTVRKQVFKEPCIS